MKVSLVDLCVLARERERGQGVCVYICELANGVKGVAACAYLKAADLEGQCVCALLPKTSGQVTTLTIKSLGPNYKHTRQPPHAQNTRRPV